MWWKSKANKLRKKVQKLAGEAQNLRDLLSRLEKQQQEKRRKQEEERRRLAALEEQRRKEAEENQKREQVKTADLIKFKPEVINEIGDNFVKARGKLSRRPEGRLSRLTDRKPPKASAPKALLSKPVRRRRLSRRLTAQSSLPVRSAVTAI